MFLRGLACCRQGTIEPADEVEKLRLRIWNRLLFTLPFVDGPSIIPKRREGSSRGLTVDLLQVAPQPIELGSTILGVGIRIDVDAQIAREEVRHRGVRKIEDVATGALEKVLHEQHVGCAEMGFHGGSKTHSRKLTY
jgi:hypothetical protein